MANNGSFTTSSADGRSLTFNWQLTSQNLNNNTSTINWELVGSGSSGGWVEAGNFKVTIDNNIVFQSATRVQVYIGTVVASGTYTFTHNENGTKNFSAYAEAGIYYYAVNCSGTGSWDLPTINRYATITNVSTFGDSQNPTVTINNPSGASLKLTLKIKSTSEVIHTVDNFTGNPVITISSASKEKIWQASPTSSRPTVTFTLYTYIGGVASNPQTYDVIYYISQDLPTMDAPSYADTNATTLAITNDSSKIIQGYSTLTITCTNIRAYKYATLSKIKFIMANFGIYEYNVSGSSIATFTRSYSNPNVSTNFGVVVTLEDSRGNKNLITLGNVQVLPYQQPSAVYSLTRKSNYYDESYLTINADYSALNGLNDLTIEYRYRKIGDESYNAYTEVQNNTTTTLSLDNGYDWDVEILLTDSLEEVTRYCTLSKGIPLVFFDTKRSSVGINCIPDGDYTIQSDGYSLDDEIFIGSQVLLSEFTSTSQGIIDMFTMDKTELILLAENTVGYRNYKLGIKFTAIMSCEGTGVRGNFVVDTYDSTIVSGSGRKASLIVPPLYVLTDDLNDEITFSIYNSGATLGTTNNVNLYNLTANFFLLKRSLH